MQQREEDNWRDGGRVHGAPEGEAGEVTGEAAGEVTGEAAGGKTLQRLGQLLPGGGCHLLTAAAGPSSYYCIVSWQQWSRSDLHGDLLIHKTDLHVIAYKDLFSLATCPRLARVSNFSWQCWCDHWWPLVTTDHCSYTLPLLRVRGSPRGRALLRWAAHSRQQERSHFYNNSGRRTTTNKADIRSADEQHLLHIVKWRHLVRVWAHTGASVGVLAPMLRHRRHTEHSGDTLRCQRVRLGTQRLRCYHSWHQCTFTFYIQQIPWNCPSMKIFDFPNCREIECLS